MKLHSPIDMGNLEGAMGPPCWTSYRVTSCVIPRLRGCKVKSESRYSTETQRGFAEGCRRLRVLIAACEYLVNANACNVCVGGWRGLMKYGKRMHAARDESNDQMPEQCELLDQLRLRLRQWVAAGKGTRVTTGSDVSASKTPATGVAQFASSRFCHGLRSRKPKLDPLRHGIVRPAVETTRGPRWGQLRFVASIRSRRQGAHRTPYAIDLSVTTFMTEDSFQTTAAGFQD
ncbi:hypothetical protein LIA77_05433 [Sarocladium implicatum]|nr:hypothetical protein LIA77_05433 [Sarocladium implicatum]